MGICETTCDLLIPVINLQIYGMFERTAGISTLIQQWSITLFAPTNEGFQKYKSGVKDDQLLYYHICKYEFVIAKIKSLAIKLNGYENNVSRLHSFSLSSHKCKLLYLK